MTTQRELSRDLKPLVRDAITSHEGWPAWRRARGIDSSKLLVPLMLDACRDLGIDIDAIERGMIRERYGIVDEVAVAETLASSSTALPPAPASLPVVDTSPLSSASPFDDMPLPEPAPEPEPRADADPLDYSGADPEAVANGVVSLVSDWIGAKVADRLRGAVLPLATAACAPRALSHPPAFTGEPPTTVRALMQGRIAPGQEDRVVDLPVSHWGSPDAPPVDPHYVWPSAVASVLALSAHYADRPTDPCRTQSRVLLHGPAGTGKTTAPQQWAALTGRPYVRLALTRETEAVELVGCRLPSPDGGTVFHEGALVVAMQRPGCVICIDEPSLVRPGTAAVFQTILDTGIVYLKEDGNRRVEMAPGVLIVACDNTNLTGDPSGRYADTMAQNLALQDRFGFVVPVDYLEPEAEARVIAARTGLRIEAVRPMVAYAALTRKGAVTGTLTAGVSIRRMTAWALAVRQGLRSADAFGVAVLSAADQADAETLLQLAVASVDHERIDREARPLI